MTRERLGHAILGAGEKSVVTDRVEALPRRLSSPACEFMCALIGSPCLSGRGLSDRSLSPICMLHPRLSQGTRKFPRKHSSEELVVLAWTAAPCYEALIEGLLVILAVAPVEKCMSCPAYTRAARRALCQVVIAEDGKRATGQSSLAFPTWRLSQTRLDSTRRASLPRASWSCPRKKSRWWWPWLAVTAA